MLALAFIAAFGLITAAVLNYAGVTGLQHVHTEATATSDSSDEAGAAYAAADANRTDLSPVDCAPGKTGTATMADGSSTKAEYKINNCNPGNSVSGFNGGTPCVLCVLNQVNPNPATVAFTYGSNGKQLFVTGDIDVNGSIGGKGTVCTQTSAVVPVQCPSPASGGPFINILSGGTCSNCGQSTTPYGTAISDPLGIGVSGGVPLPTPPASGLCSLAAPCTGSSGVLSMGASGVAVYSSISGNATFVPGVYVVTGSSGGNVTWMDTAMHGVTIYLACATAGGAYDASCATPANGGSITFSGGGSAALTSPTSGVYNGIVLLAAPKHTGTLLDNKGNGGSMLTGTVDMPSGDWSDTGGGSTGVSVAGRLIANTVTSDTDKGHPLDGLRLTGGGVPNFNGCSVFDDSVGTSPLRAQPARSIIQQQCTGALNVVTGGGLVALNYQP